MAKMRAVNFRMLTFALALSVTSSGWAAEPFNSATLTRVENRVSIGRVRSGHAESQRPASINDVIRADEYLQTETSSRAELQFGDRSIVRVGQNAVFSFDAGSRTLSLQKGAMLFYVPPGNGGHIKTPTLTAAITGTIGKATPNLIAVVSGSLDTPWGPVTAGHAIGINPQTGQPEIFPYPLKEATTGILYAWGPLPELPEAHPIFDPRYGIPDQHWWDIMDAVLNSSSRAPKPKDEANTPEPQDNPKSQGSGY